MTFYNPLSREDVELLTLTKFSELKPEITLKKSSVAATILATNGYFIEGQEQVISDLTNQCFLFSATGTFLDELARDSGFIRQPAVASSGLVSFSRQNPATSDIIITEGVVVQTSPDSSGAYSTYKTTEEITILAGEYHKSALVECEEAGVGGNTESSGQASIVSGDAIFTTNTYGVSSNSYELEVIDIGSLSVTVSGSLVTVGINGGVTTIDEVKTEIEGNLSANNLITLQSSASIMPEIQPTFFSGAYNGSISVFGTSVASVDFVTNTEAFTNGQEKESDDDFRDRIQEGLSNNFGNGTTAWYERIAREVTDVKTAKVIRHTNRVASISCGDDSNEMTFLAKSYGEYGNDISVEVVDTGSLGIVVSGLQITININLGVTTLQEVADAINANSVARALITTSFIVLGTETIVELILSNLAGGLNEVYPPNQITVYITQSNEDGFPDTTLINTVEEELSSDDNRLVCDYIVVKPPEAIDVTVDCVITEYESGYDELEVRTNVKNALISYIATLETGEKMYVRALEQIIIGSAGVLDFTLTDPSANIDPLETQKVRLTEANCVIS